MNKVKNVLRIDSDKILDYVQGECSETDLFKKGGLRLTTTNAHDRDVFRREFEEYIDEWNDYE